MFQVTEEFVSTTTEGAKSSPSTYLFALRKRHETGINAGLNSFCEDAEKFITMIAASLSAIDIEGKQPANRDQYLAELEDIEGASHTDRLLTYFVYGNMPYDKRVMIKRLIGATDTKILTVTEHLISTWEARAAETRRGVKPKPPSADKLVRVIDETTTKAPGGEIRGVDAVLKIRKDTVRRDKRAELEQEASASGFGTVAEYQAAKADEAKTTPRSTPQLAVSNDPVDVGTRWDAFVTEHGKGLNQVVIMAQNLLKLSPAEKPGYRHI
jgi:hypothetical protein